MRPLPPMAAEPASTLFPGRGPCVARHFTHPGLHPLDLAEWERRVVPISGPSGEPERRLTVEVPWFWSRPAAESAARLLLEGALGVTEGRSSVRQAILRIASTLSTWGREGGYFSDDAAAETFEHELAYLLLHQMLAFGLPAWLSLGLDPEPRCCACPITSVGESTGSVLDLACRGGSLFCDGTGSGTNLSRLRSAEEGGAAAGPIRFLEQVEAVAEVIRPTGQPGAASSIAILDVAHPDIRRFIGFQPGAAAGEGRPPWATARAVRLSDAFMNSVLADEWWELRAVGSGEVVGKERSRDLLSLIVTSAIRTGQPQVQFDDTINRWNTCAAWGRITASSPCAEFTFLDDTACQLAWLNLLPFLDLTGRFRPAAFCHAVDLAVLALEIMVGTSRYPTERIAARTRELRPLGLGYVNLGALLMAAGLAYDSDEGRALAAAVTSLATGQAYLQSARVAAGVGSFPAYPANRTSVLEVVDRHREAARGLRDTPVPDELLGPATAVWDEALALGTRSGFRNAQVTALAPTNDMARLMDCVALGADPVPALHADPDGGRPVNEVLGRALARLGYDTPARGVILNHLRASGSLDGCSILDLRHRSVLACAEAVTPRGQLAMVAAVQRFLSGTAARSLSLPAAATAHEAEQLVVEAWRLGVKTLGLQRGGDRTGREAAEERALCQIPCGEPRRRPLPDQRQVVTHTFAAAGHPAQVAVGLYEDGSPGELVITMAREGSVLTAVVESLASAVSTSLQCEVPLGTVLERLSRLNLEPTTLAGAHSSAHAATVLDHVARWLEARFLSTAPRDCPACAAKLPGRDLPVPSAHAERAAATSVQLELPPR